MSLFCDAFIQLNFVNLQIIYYCSPVLLSLFTIIQYFMNVYDLQCDIGVYRLLNQMSNNIKLELYCFCFSYFKYNCTALTVSLQCVFYAPGIEDRGHIVFGLSVCVCVCQA